MAGEDLERMKKFYEGVFGWKMQQLGAEMGNYVVAHTDETDEQGMLKKSNRINGGFYKKMDNPVMNTPSVVIAVENLEESMKKVKDAGGSLMNEPMEIPGIGKYVSLMDTEGNRVGMLQPSHPM